MTERIPKDNASISFSPELSYENLGCLLGDVEEQETDKAKEFPTVTLNNEDREGFKKLGEKIHDFNKLFFTEEENDVAGEYEVAMERNLSNFYAKRNEKGEIVALLNSQFIEGENGLSMVIWYVATKKDYQDKGLALSLYKQAYKDFLEKAQKEDKTAYGIFGETVDGIEVYLNNKFGRKRMYIERNDGNMEEIYYASPPADIGQEPTEEHFMGRLIGGEETMNSEDFVDVMNSIYGEFLKPDYFEDDTEEGRIEYKKEIDGALGAVTNQLARSKDGKIYFMSKEEREKKKEELTREGKTIVELEATE